VSSQAHANIEEDQGMANVTRRKSAWRVIAGIALIIFGVVGGLGRLASGPGLGSANAVNTVLSEASRPLDNAIAIGMMVVLVAMGLGLTGVLDGLKQTHQKD
jgi:hypothetical protein